MKEYIVVISCALFVLGAVIFGSHVGLFDALAKSSHPLVPEIMMAGDSKGGAGNAMDAVGLNMLMDLTNKLSSK